MSVGTVTNPKKKAAPPPETKGKWDDEWDDAWDEPKKEPDEATPSPTPTPGPVPYAVPEPITYDDPSLAYTETAAEETWNGPATIELLKAAYQMQDYGQSQSDRQFAGVPYPSAREWDDGLMGPQSQPIRLNNSDIDAMKAADREASRGIVDPNDPAANPGPLELAAALAKKKRAIEYQEKTDLKGSQSKLLKQRNAMEEEAINAFLAAHGLTVREVGSMRREQRREAKMGGPENPFNLPDPTGTGKHSRKGSREDITLVETRARGRQLVEAYDQAVGQQAQRRIAQQAATRQQDITAGADRKLADLDTETVQAARTKDVQARFEDEGKTLKSERDDARKQMADIQKETEEEAEKKALEKVAGDESADLKSLSEDEKADVLKEKEIQRKKMLAENDEYQWLRDRAKKSTSRLDARHYGRPVAPGKVREILTPDEDAYVNELAKKHRKKPSVVARWYAEQKLGISIAE